MNITNVIIESKPQPVPIFTANVLNDK